MAVNTDLPPVRACIFDMDGLLIDSEDAYTRVTNTILSENGRPELPWSIKAQLQGRPGPQAGKIFHNWAKLDIGQEQFLKRQAELQAVEFQHCKPLPGVELLLQTLSTARTAQSARKVKLAVATSSHEKNFQLKTKTMKPLFSVFPENRIIVGDDPRVPRGRGKPLPDIYLLALQVINEEIERSNDGEKPITPEECLVFEDSVPGAEAGRRAGMRVIWVPHPGLLDVYKDRIKEVLAGATGEAKESDLVAQAGSALPGSPGSVGQIDDGWAERLSTLEDFNYTQYGIDVTSAQIRSESDRPAQPGTTDTAKAGGKLDVPEKGSPRHSISTPSVPGLQEGTAHI